MIANVLLAVILGTAAEPVPSDECLSCHDVGRVSHVVGIVYRPGPRLKNAPPELLVDGRVECTTCHVSHARETDTRYRLRVPWEEQAALCMSCHDLG